MAAPKPHSGVLRATASSRIDADDSLKAKAYGFLAVFLLALAVFLPVARGEFLHWDDDTNILENPHLEGPVSQVVRWSFTDTGHDTRYPPLCRLTWAALAGSFGFNPFYFHLAVLLFHAVNAGLVFLLIRRLLVLGAQKPGTGSIAFTMSAALAAGVWAVHPLRVETTAWAVELTFVQPLFFFLLSLLAYLRPNEANGHRRGFYVASVVLFAVSLASYPLALGGFVVFAALDFFPLRRLGWEPTRWFARPERNFWIEKIPFVLIALFFGWLNLRSRALADVEVKPPTLAEFGVVPRVMQAFFIWAHNVWKPFVPFHLSPVPPQLVNFKPFAPLFIFSAVLVIGLTVILFFRRRRWTGIFMTWIFFLALLVPALGLSEHPHFSSDRYSLGADIGWSILLGGLLVDAWPRRNVRVALLSLVVVVIYGLSRLSRQQTELWRTNIGFFRTLIAQTQNEPALDNYRLQFYERLATSCDEHGDNRESAETLRAAIRMWPQASKPYSLLGATLEKGGDSEGAVANFQAAVARDPGSLPAMNDLGVAYAKAGKLEEAKGMFTEVLRRDASEKTALQNMAQALTLQGKTNEAQVYLHDIESLPNAELPGR
jgi:Flp pilus assembly protein TadD